MSKASKLSRTAPGAVWLLGLIAILAMALPIAALLSKVPWSQFLVNINKPAVLSALRVSFGTSIVIAIVAAIIGVPLAFLLSRGPALLTTIVRPIVISALVFPPTVAGLALLALLGQDGVLGKLLFNFTGWVFPGTTIAVVVAGLFVGMPFLVLVVQASFDHLDPNLEESAETDGASQKDIFRDVVLPQTLPAILAGMALTWARALGEFGATMTFAGAIPGKTFTTAMQVYADLKTDEAAAYSLSAFMLIISITVLTLLRGKWLPALRRSSK